MIGQGIIVVGEIEHRAPGIGIGHPLGREAHLLGLLAGLDLPSRGGVTLDGEDLNRLDPGGVQTLLRAVEKDKLGLALKGASEGLRDLFFSNMSERAGKLLREDMAALGPVRLKEVEEAQMELIQMAKDLAARGEIVLSDNKGGDELVY